jgi:hypothetical protein
VKGSHQPPQSAKKKRRGAKKTGKAPAFRSKIVDRIGRQINDRWPNLGRRFASLLRVSREKIDDLYSSAAQALSEHKEAFDDGRAARKAQGRVEIRTVPQAASARRSPRARTASGSVVPPAPKRTSSSSKSRS